MTDIARRLTAFARVILLSGILMPLVLGCPDLPDGEGTVPDIYINCDGMSVGMNDTVHYAATVVGETRDLVFTIENKGTADLELTGGPVILSGSETFTVQKDPSILIKPGGASTFTVRFAPIDTSDRTAAVSIVSNDPDENPFTFQLMGSGSVVSGSILINGGDQYTDSASVTLAMTPEDPVSIIEMVLADNPDFTGADWVPFLDELPWLLTGGDGTNTVYVKFRDAVGNESPVFSDDIILDTTPPDAPGTPDLAAADDSGISATDDLTNVTSGLTFSGSGAEEGCTVQLYANGVPLSGAVSGVGTGGAWSADASLSEGTWTITARATDPAGNTSDASEGLVVVIDTTGPAAAPSILLPMQGTNTGVRKRPFFSWTAVDGAARYDLQADNQTAFTSPEVDLISYNGTSYTPPVNLPVSASAPVGTRYYIRVRGVDEAGNGGPWSHSGIRRYVNVGRFDDDANGDGYSDVLAGAPYNDAGRTNSGSAYLYFGGSAMNATSDSIFSGAAVGDEFGTSAAFAGDVNGDGYCDIIVGAPFNDAGGTDAGRAYLYFGGAGVLNVADLILTGSAAGERFGYSVASAGDVNGDGYCDIIVGASYSSAGGTNAGRAYVYLGNSTPDAQADLILTGAAAYDYLGNSVSAAGDMNGDGFDDFVICAIQNDAGGTNAGSAYVYLGGAVLIGTADLILTGQNPSDFFGSSASSAGDVNGDGYGDLIVGAMYNDAGGVDAGRAYLYLGSAVLNATADLVLTGTSAYDFFGQVVAPAGDVNGDGYGDFIVGAPVNDAGGTDAGSVYLYLGGAAADSSADLTSIGAAASDFFGRSAASAGDVNGDGYGDFIVGAPFNDAGGTNSGSAYLYFGGIGLDGTPDVILTGAAAGDSFGTSVD